jgi:hypothetical protein
LFATAFISFLKLIALLKSVWLEEVEAADDNPAPIVEPTKDDVNNEPEDCEH